MPDAVPETRAEENAFEVEEEEETSGEPAAKRQKVETPKAEDSEFRKDLDELAEKVKEGLSEIGEKQQA